MALIFEWDRRKAGENLRKHRLSFEEAVTAFGDLQSLTIHDPDHSQEEDRFVLLGRTRSGRIAVVVHAERGENIRIISARMATRREQAIYADG